MDRKKSHHSHKNWRGAQILRNEKQQNDPLMTKNEVQPKSKIDVGLFAKPFFIVLRHE